MRKRRAFLVFLLAAGGLAISSPSAQGACATRGYQSSRDVGGVRLDKTATFITEMTGVTGGYYNEASGQIVLTGHQEASLPRMNQDDLAVAIRTIYDGRVPEVSIDPPPGGFGQGHMVVTMPPELDDTHFGWVLFEADRVLKAYTLGKDNVTGQPIVSSVPGYKSVLERWKEKEMAGSTGDGTSVTRYWFVPKAIPLKRTDDGNSFVFAQVAIELLTEQMGSSPDPDAWAAAQEFASHFNANYLAFAAERPVLFELLELAKITGVVRWIRENSIPMDTTWVAEYPVGFQEVPATTPEIIVEARFTIGNTTYTLQITGGVQFAKPNNYFSDPAAAQALKDAAEQAQPAETTFLWNFSDAGNPRKALAQSLKPSLKAGSFSRLETDLSISTRGQFPLQFQRWYSSFEQEEGPLGIGWSQEPLKLHFPTPTLQASFDWTSERFFYEILVLDRTTGRQTTYNLAVNSGFPSLYVSSDPAVHAKLQREADGTYTLTQKDRSIQRFDSQGRLIAQKDKNGNQTSYTYDGNSRLTTIADPVGRSLTTSYTGNRLTQVASPDPAIAATYAYDLNGDLVRVSHVGPEGTELHEQYTYDSEHRLIQVQDGEGRVLAETSYDAFGRTNSQKDASGTAWSASFNLDHRILTETDGARTTQRVFDAKYRPTVIADAEGKVTQLAYVNSSDEPATVTDPKGVNTFFGYDVRGNRVFTILPNPFGHVTQYAYDSQDQLTGIADGRYDMNGLGAPKVTTFTYDTNGNLTQQEEAFVGQTTTFTYDLFGNRISQTDPLGHATQFAYDAKGNLTSLTDPLGNITTHEYDTLSRRTATIDPLGHRTSSTYDSDGDLIQTQQTVTDPLGTPIPILTRFAYDSQRNLIERTDPNGHLTRYTYNAKTQLTSVTDALSQVTTYTYDAHGNKIASADSNGRITQFEYDKLNRLTAVVRPSGLPTTFAYDANGNRTRRATPDGQTTTYDYDTLNRLIRTTYPDAAIHERLYDPRGNLIETRDPTGLARYSYDPFDRLASQIDQHNRRVDYRYDKVGNLIRLTYPDGRLVDHVYDSNDRLKGAFDWLTPTVATTFFYDKAGNLTDYRRPNDLVTSYTYDEANRLNQIEHWHFVDRFLRARSRYQLDLAGNRLREVTLTLRELPRTYTDEPRRFTFQERATTYAYDSLDRLTGYTAPLGSATYTYDSVGNRLSTTTPQDTVTATYNEDDELLSLSDGTSFRYDKRGNLTTRWVGTTPIRSYRYDHENWLIAVQGPVNFVTGQPVFQTRFTYDTQGRRLARASLDGLGNVLESTRSTYKLDGPLPVLLQETDSSSAVTRTYLYGSDLLAEEAGPEVTWPLPDALGTPLAHVNQAGALTTVLNYDPWGVRLQALDAGLLSGALPFPAATSGLTPTHTFTGEPTMGGATDDGLVYLRARWYDPTLGRFLTRDPVVEDDAPATSTREVLQDTEPQLFHRDDRNPQGLHPYIYVQNNPVRFIDPTGEAAWGAVARAAAGAIRAGAAAGGKWFAKEFTITHPGKGTPAGGKSSGYGIAHRRSGIWVAIDSPHGDKGWSLDIKKGNKPIFEYDFTHEQARIGGKPAGKWIQDAFRRPCD